MKTFHLDNKMVTLGGVFYPTGHMMLMLPTERDALDAERKLEDAGIAGETISLLTPSVILQECGRNCEEDGLPSAGTEAETVRHFCQLAKDGHHALLIHAPSMAQTQRVMEILKDAPISYGQKYRHLVIEDLVT